MESSTVAWRPTPHPRIVPLNQTMKFHAKELEHLLDKEFEIVGSISTFAERRSISSITCRWPTGSGWKR